ncbi:hypothetical protein Q8F55_000151 [Vanrija albida]|uniref:Uncharacterized protein n=1 Tax=Vanrija albida TaxID=181172 RepID=A0ABR3QCF9_9TREE
MRLYYPTYPGRFTVSVGTRGPTVALGPASNEGDLVTPLRAVAADYKFMSEPKEADACTCWDDIAEGTFIHKRGTARSKKATVPRDALVANRRATRASMVPALNVLATAEHARKLPTEIWHMVWGFLPGDGMSAAQAARAVELGWGDGAATLSKRAATFGHLDGAEFGAALDQWLVSEGF